MFCNGGKQCGCSVREVRQSEGRNLKANKKKTSDENVVLLLTATIQESTHDVSGLSSERPPTTAGPAPAVFFGSSILVQSGAKRGKSKLQNLKSRIFTKNNTMADSWYRARVLSCRTRVQSCVHGWVGRWMREKHCRWGAGLVNQCLLFVNLSDTKFKL